LTAAILTCVRWLKTNFYPIFSNWMHPHPHHLCFRLVLLWKEVRRGISQFISGLQSSSETNKNICFFS
jgi:hypothetical protein